MQNYRSQENRKMKDKFTKKRESLTRTEPILHDKRLSEVPRD
jgi:hypothetical protein